MSSITPTSVDQQAANLRVITLRDQKVPSWPYKTEEKKRLAEGNIIARTLGWALHTEHRTDAHIAAYDYDPPAGEKHGRLRIESADFTAVRMTLLIVDVDSEEAHSSGFPATDSWFEEEWPYIDRLPGPPMCYRTRKGYRLVWRLPEPRPTEGWREFYFRVLTYLRDRGISGDPKCGDWTRVFRLPHATRDAGPDAQPERLYVSSQLPGVWSVPDSDLQEIAPDLQKDLSRPQNVVPITVVRPSVIDPNKVMARARSYLEKMPGAIQGQGGHPTTFKAAIRMVEYFDLSVEQCLQLLREVHNPKCLPPWSEEELRHKAEDARSRAKVFGTKLVDPPELSDEELEQGTEGMAVTSIDEDREIEALLHPEQVTAEQTTEQALEPKKPDWKKQIERHRGRPVASVRNAVLIGTFDDQLKDALGYDSFSGRTVWVQPPPWDGGTYAGATPWEKGQEVTDEDATRLSVWMANKYKINMDPASLHKVIDLLADCRSYHPVVDYLRSVTWDGCSRLGGKDGTGWLTKYVGVEDSEYVRKVGRMFLIAMVGRVMRPGDLFKNVLVLEGPQDARKSTLCSVLGGQWFSESLSEIGSKDSYQDIRGVWLLELAELSGLTRSESNTIKHFIATRSDRYRKSYGRRSITVPRQTVLIGTTNDTEWSKDETGGARWWPVRVGHIDIEAVQRDRDQLFAEALAAFEAGEKWYLESGDPLLGDFRSEQEDRRAKDVWEETLAAHLSSLDAVTMDEVLTHLGMADASSRDPMRQARARRALTALGWERRQVRDGERRSWSYVRGPLAAPKSPASLAPENDLLENV